MPASAHDARPAQLHAARTPLSRRSLLAVAGVGGTTAAIGMSALSPVAARPGRARKTAVVQSGLYAWPVDYLAQRTNVRSLGSQVLRLAHDTMSDDAWAAVQSDRLDAHITISGNDRAGFASEAAWIADYLARVDSIMARWPFKWVEVWNEPNFGMWTGASDVDRQRAYGNLLVATFSHIKQHYPGTGVIGFAAGGSSAAAPGFITGVLRQVPAAATSFDVCSLHPYIMPSAPEDKRREFWGSWTVAQGVQEIRSAGVRTPIWFTEIGWQVSQADGGKYAVDTSTTVSPQLQASYALRTFLLCMKLGVPRVNHMYVIDTDNFNGGFFTPSGPRPQALAMAAQHQLLKKPRGLTIRSDGQNGLYDYLVHTARGPVAVTWSTRGTPHPVRQHDSRVVAFDLFGKRADQQVGRSGVINLTGQPMYMVPTKTASLHGYHVV